MSDERTKKPYNEKKKQYNIEYLRKHYKLISASVNKDYYNDVLVPYANSIGVSMHTLIKNALEYYIDNDIGMSKKK